MLRTTLCCQKLFCHCTHLIQSYGIAKVQRAHFFASGCSAAAMSKMSSRMSQPGAACRIWPLERYAYQTTQPNQKKTEVWQQCVNTTSEKLELTITPTDQILIHYGKRQMENLSVARTHSWIKGITKGDSLMVIVKLQEATRRFRVKFSGHGGETGDTRCRECVDRLARCFDTKDMNFLQTGGTPTSSLTQDPGNESMTLSGDVSVSQLAQAMTDPGRVQMPNVYTDRHAHEVTHLNMFIKLCLADETFPAFVESVEKELRNIKAEF